MQLHIASPRAAVDAQELLKNHAALKDAYNKAEEEISVLDDQVEANNQEIERLKSVGEALEVKIGTTYAARDALDGELSAVESQLDDLEIEYDPVGQ